MNKVTKEGIEARIKSTVYHVIPGTTLTICIITMLNGWDVRGDSACVDPANFNATTGQEEAYKNAFDQIWALEGYLLQEKTSSNNPDTTFGIGEAVSAMMSGQKVSRAGWNGKGMYLVWVGPLNWNVSGDITACCSDATDGRYGFAMMRTADNKLVPWLCSQADMFASDWGIVQPTSGATL